MLYSEIPAKQKMEKYERIPGYTWFISVSEWDASLSQGYPAVNFAL